MNIMQLQLLVNYGKEVWHVESYQHPQLHIQVPGDFYGRREAREGARTLLNDLPRPIVIVGERRAGKSSIFKWFMRSPAKEPGFIPIEMTWNNIQASTDSGVRAATSLMREILNSIYETLDLHDETLLASFERIALSTQFRGAMQKMLKGLQDKVIVLGIDEFDSVIMQEPDDEAEQRRVISVIVSMIESEELPLKIILTMTRAPGSMEHGYSSPLTTKTDTIRLEPFSKTELDEMILGILNKEISITPRDLDEIFRLSGGWPFFAKALLFHWVPNPDGENSLDLARQKAAQDTRLSDALNHIYDKHWSILEKKVILLLAKCGGKLSAQEKSLLDASLNAAAMDLVERGYLQAQEGGFSFRIALLRDWLLQWPKYEEQAQKHVGQILESIQRKKDPWAGLQDDEIFDGTTLE